VEKITVSDHGDRSYPFRRELFEDPCVVYHGSWSTWSPQVEATGFHQGDFPFEWKCVATVCNRTRAIGRGSFLSAFLDKQRNLFLRQTFGLLVLMPQMVAVKLCARRSKKQTRSSAFVAFQRSVMNYSNT